METTKILKKLKTKRTLIHRIVKRKMKFLGHIKRKKALKILAFTGNIRSMWGSGKQRLIYILNILNFKVLLTSFICSVFQNVKDRGSPQFPINCNK